MGSSSIPRIGFSLLALVHAICGQKYRSNKWEVFKKCTFLLEWAKPLHFLLYPCILSLIHLKVHSQPYIYRKISRVAPP